MFSISDYQTELTRLQVLNQRYVFLMNAIQYVKIRQAGAPADLKFEIMEKKVTTALEELINKETTATITTAPQPTTPKLELI
jgi:hypothetical protein